MVNSAALNGLPRDLLSSDVPGERRLKVESVANPDIPVNAENGVGKGINLDVWGKQKVAIDQSILHGMFTYNVPRDKWLETVNGVEVGMVNSSSVDGELHLDAGATLNDTTVLRTFRSPRYQPNRGHLYSTSIFLENPTDDGIRDFGSFTDESGFFFRQRSTGLYACRVERTPGDVFTVIEELITNLPATYDPEKGNIYDIQVQWRGVGSYVFWIGDPATGVSTKVHTMANLGTLTGLSTYNPANPIAYRSINLGDNVKIRSGCVDISSEGGGGDGASYGSVATDNDNGQVSISGLNQPLIAVRAKTLFEGLINTRDTLALLASFYSDQKSVARVWATRDFTAITENDQSWQDFRDGHLEYIVYDVPPVGSEMEFDTSKAELVFSARSPQDVTYATSALFEGRTNIYITPGDMFVFTMHRENSGSANAGCTFEFAEEV